MSITDFNDRPEAELRAQLAGCLDVPGWVEEVVAGRPYADTAALMARARTRARAITADELERALARHPRIGERAQDGRHDAAFSAQEQSGVDRDDRAIAEALARGNRRYEDRFDRVFLVRAAGRNAREILTELDRRLDNDDATEQRETIEQLTQIALLRLQQVVG